MALADQLACFKEDSQLRDICLRKGTAALQCTVATPFFANFKRTTSSVERLPPNVTAFGSPTPLHVEQGLDTFKALFRHFCYGFADLALPKGAFYAGSSCVAALASKLQAQAMGLEASDQAYAVTRRSNRLAFLEGRVQKIMREPLILQTITKVVKEPALAQKIMDFIHDDFLTLKDLHREVEAVLETSTPDIPWEFAGKCGLEDDESHEDGQHEKTTEMVHSSFYYDENGLGPYARSDIDIMVVAQTEEEAKDIIQKTLEKIKSHYGNCHVYKTPCSVQIIGDFPLRHVQIITVINKCLDEYLLFCDLDCTALAFDGNQLYGSRRAYFALNTGYNIVPQEMLENRYDTPRRLSKYNSRGFASLVPGDLTETARKRLRQAQAIGPPKPFFDVAEWNKDPATWGEEQLIAHLTANAGRWRGIRCTVEMGFGAAPQGHPISRLRRDNNNPRFYTETNLPRGYGITADRAAAILKRLQTKAKLWGRSTVVSKYHGTDDLKLIFKMAKTPENWVRWGLASADAADEPHYCQPAGFGLSSHTRGPVGQRKLS